MVKNVHYNLQTTIMTSLDSIHKMLLVFSFVCTGFVSRSQDTNEQISQANIRIDDIQKRFESSIAPKSMDEGTKNLLLRFITVQTDSIQNVLQNESDTGQQEKLQALKGHAAFLDAFQYEIVSNSFEVYQIRDMRNKYLLIWDQLRHKQPYDAYMNTLGPKKSKIIATAFKEYPEGPRLRDMTILKTARYSPDRIPGWLTANKDYHFTDSLIFIWANRAPASLVKFVKTSGNQELVQKIKDNQFPLVQTLVKMSSESRVNNYLPFAVPIMNGELSYDTINMLRAEPTKYFQKVIDEGLKTLNEQASGQNPLYIIPLRAFAKEYAVKFFVNVMNTRHEEANEKVRFGELNQLRPIDLYAIIIYGEDNFYTSSYLYTYKRLTGMFKKGNYDSLLRLANYAGYRNFIRLAGRYNTLNDFLSNMPKDTMTAIMTRLVYGLEDNTDQGLQEAMTVAETFPSLIKEKELSAFMEVQIAENLERCKKQSNFYGQKLYRLLQEIYSAVKIENENNGESISGKLAEYLVLSHQSLRDTSGRITQQVYFYGDDDGKASYQSFLTNFKDGNTWSMEKTDHWVAFHSKKQFPVSVYANLPLEYLEDLDRAAQDTLKQYLAGKNINPHIIIHRGHSYHLSNSLTNVTPDIKLAVLGSCGGYSEIFDVQMKSEDAQVISTKQVGSKTVNEPLLTLINKNLLEEKDIRWQELWDTLDKQLLKDKKAYAYFVDYIPPHKNIGLLVAKLYHDDGDQ